MIKSILIHCVNCIKAASTSLVPYPLPSNNPQFCVLCDKIMCSFKKKNPNFNILTFIATLLKVLMSFFHHTHTHTHTHSQLLFKAAKFSLAVCQLECQTLGWLLAATTQGHRGCVSLALPVPTQLCHPLGGRGEETGR